MHPKKVKGLSQNNNDKVLNDSMGTNVPTHNYANSILMLTLYTKPLLNAIYVPRRNKLFRTALQSLIRYSD